MFLKIGVVWRVVVRAVGSRKCWCLKSLLGSPWRTCSLPGSALSLGRRRGAGASCRSGARRACPVVLPVERGISRERTTPRRVRILRLVADQRAPPLLRACCVRDSQSGWGNTQVELSGTSPGAGRPYSWPLPGPRLRDLVGAVRRPLPQTRGCTTHNEVNDTPGAIREGSLRSAYQQLYPGIRAEVWYVAGSLASVVGRSRSRRDVTPGRVLSDLHFEFRGGEEPEPRPPGARTRSEDQPSE